MLIANPILDTVFKYLLEDHEIAIGLLSRITGLNIINLELKPTELAYEKFLNLEDKLSNEQKLKINEVLAIYRFDFKAIVKEANGKHKVVLIEIQKSDVLNQLGRFRDYLAQNYKQTESLVNAEGKTIFDYLEIICIYFLNCNLDKIHIPILKKEHKFIDVETNQEVIIEDDYADFVRLLNHRSIFIQIPKLTGGKESDIRQLLDIFNQSKKKQLDTLELNYNIEDIKDELKKRILHRLSYVLLDDNMKAMMKHESEFDNYLNKNRVEKKELLDTIEKKDKTIEQKDKTIEHSILSLSKFIKDPQQIATELGIDVERVNLILKNKIER